MERGLDGYIDFYNKKPRHTALDQRTPTEGHWTCMRNLNADADATRHYNLAGTSDPMK